VNLTQVNKSSISLLGTWGKSFQAVTGHAVAINVSNRYFPSSVGLPSSSIRHPALLQLPKRVARTVGDDGLNIGLPASFSLKLFVKMEYMYTL